MRGKWMKIAAIIAGAVLVLTVALIILARVLVTPERVRSAVLPVAEDFLHRPVDLEKIEVGLFSGISCSGLAIGERQGQENFIQAESLVLRYRFWPLLVGRVVVDEATLNRPVVRIARYTDGRFSFADLLGSSDSTRGDSANAEPARKGSPIDLLVTRLAVESGRIEFTDRAVRSERAVVTRLDELNLAAQQLSLEKSFPIELDFLLNDAPVSWKGTVDPSDKRAAGRLKVSGLAAAPLAPYAAEAFPGDLRAMQIDADLEIDGGPQALTSRGVLHLDNIALTLDALPGTPVEEARLELDHDLTVEAVERKMEIRSLRAQYNRVALELEAGSVDYAQPLELDASLRLPKLAIPDLVASLPPALAKRMTAMAPSGQIQGRVRLAGRVSSPETLIAEGSVSLEQAGLRVGHLEPRMSGTVHLKKDRLSAERMELEAAASRFTFDLTARRLFDEVKYAATNLQAENVDFSALLPPEKTDVDSPSAGAPGERKQSEPVGLPLEMDGEVRIAEGRYKGLSLKDVRLDWRLADNVLRIERFSTATASGTVRGKTVLDLGRRQPAYDANIQVEDVDADEIVTALAPRAADTVFGSLDLSANLQGFGANPAAIRKNLAGGGSFAIRHGELTGAGIMQGLAAFLDLDDLRVFRFDLGEGTFDIRDGSIFLDASFEGSRARLLPNGRIGFDQTLDMSLKTFLSPENTKKLAGRGTFGEVIADKGGWGLLPLRIAGTLSDPSFSLDRRALTEQIKKGTERKLREKLREKIREEVESPQDGKDEPAKKLLRDTLKGLFGN